TRDPSDLEPNRFGIPILLALALLAAWLSATTLIGRRIFRDALGRVCLLGPVIGIIVFVFASPFAEVRFVNPAFLLLFACAAVPARWAESRQRLALLGLNLAALVL